MYRGIDQIICPIETSDGAGVKLKRVIGTQALPEVDPFLMLDLFGTDRPEDYIAGFPDHPHRGFETVTYMLEGRMRHKDNAGHEGVLTSGGVQWMTAGRGIIHSEMPEQEEGLMRGFQLWVNLPAKDKMQAPRYQEFAAKEVTQWAIADGIHAKLIAGELEGKEGPVKNISVSPLFVDFDLLAGRELDIPLSEELSAFLYIYEGDLCFDGEEVPKDRLIVLDQGDRLKVKSRKNGTRFIVVAGRPLNEPVARYGPFVMNTQDEIRQAFKDYQAGRF